MIKRTGMNTMIKNERLDKIIEILERKKHCTINFLASQLYVTPITIRRDIAILSEQGRVSKCYGGVSIVTHSNREVPLAVREAYNSDTKAAIAANAARLITKGSTIFLDASSTAAHIVDFLTPEQGVTVITNSIKTLMRLAERQITAYGTGGRLLHNSLAFAGAKAETTVSTMHADFMFFSSQGITLDGNITDFSEAETQLRQVMMSRADKCYFLCDSSKVGKTFLFQVCNISDLSGVFCDKKLEFNV